MELISDAYRDYGDRMVVANSLGKDSVAVWHLAKKVSPLIRGFIVTTRYKPAETVAFMHEEVARYPELKVFKNDGPHSYPGHPPAARRVCLNPRGGGRQLARALACETVATAD